VKIIPMEGVTVGSIRVLSFAGVRPAGRTGRAYWNAVCLACGKRLVISGAKLRERERENRSPSCGCVTSSRFNTKPGRKVMAKAHAASARARGALDRKS
jgi:hypothetical protein